MFFIVPPPAGTLSDSEAVRLAFEEFTMTLVECGTSEMADIIP